MLHALALGWPGPFEMIIIAGIGLLIFGKRLPEVGRSVGKTIVEFKKGMREVENELNDSADSSSPSSRPALTPPHKFDPYTGKPTDPVAASIAAGYKFDPNTGKPLEPTTADSDAAPSGQAPQQPV